MKQFIIILGMIVCSTVMAQNRENMYYGNDPDIGGDVVIKSESVRVVGDNIYKTFEIESFEDGAYYLDAWIMAFETEKGCSEYKVAVNGVSSESTFKPPISGWQALALTDTKKSAATVRLRKGINSISVIGKGPIIPNVEFIKLSSSPLRAGISDKNYREFMEKVASNTLYDTQEMDISHTSNANDRGTYGEVYDYSINMPVYYTTQAGVIPSVANSSITVSTSQSGSFAHVIEIFHETNPQTYSWSQLVASTTGSLTVTLPVIGTYIIRLRAYTHGTSGVVSLILGGGKFITSAVTGSKLSSAPTAGTYSFICKSSVDTWLYLEDNSGTPGKIVACSDISGNGIQPQESYKALVAPVGKTSQAVWFSSKS
jgi:hypothetical protein